MVLSAPPLLHPSPHRVHMQAFVYHVHVHVHVNVYVYVYA